MGTLFIARHGESVWNAEHRIQGQRDVPLSDRGVCQAQALAQRLEAERVDLVFTSDLQRAHNTAQAVAALQPSLREPIRVRAALRERHYGSWEGLTAAEAREQWERRAALSAAGAAPGGKPATAPDVWEGPPDAETFGDLIDRLLSAWKEVATELDGGATVALVGHAGSLRALLCGLTATPPAEQRRWHMDNAALSRLTWDGGQVRVEQWNDASHTVEPAAGALGTP